jgi:hypothetical protein
MSRIKISYSIKNEYDDINSVTKANLKDNILSYKEEDKTKVKYDYDNRRLERTNEAMSMIYDFKNGEAIIDVKAVGSIVKLKLESLDYKNDNYNLLEQYKLEDEIIEYRIEVL